VQHGEHDVDAGEGAGHVARRVHLEVAPGRVAAQDERGAGAVDFGQHAVGDAQAVGVVLLEHPAPVGGEADGDDVVALAVQRPQHRTGRHARDRVLTRAAAEHDGDPDPSALAHAVNPSGRPAALLRS